MGVDEACLERTAQQLAQTRAAAGEDRVLLHGAGSFGHFHARQYALKHGSSHPKYLPIGFAQTRSSVTRLNGLVVSALLAHGLPAVSVHPFPQWRKRRNVMCLTKDARGAGVLFIDTVQGRRKGRRDLRLPGGGFDMSAIRRSRGRK